jgi:hypothetical protein
MTGRSFPFSPRSTQALERGDLIAVPREPSGWACLQVVDLIRSGPGARSTFVAGVLPWQGDEPPTQQAVSGLAACDQGLVHVQIFTEGGLEVVAAGHVVATDAPSNLRGFGMGSRHKVWGWQTAIRRAQNGAT